MPRQISQLTSGPSQSETNVIPSYANRYHSTCIRQTSPIETGQHRDRIRRLKGRLFCTEGSADSEIEVLREVFEGK